ncbi:MAG: hypothetical protein JHC33_07340 [Ignisphaera sp.]|nr:hypothetical protein [Ignisphaera sp.]
MKINDLIHLKGEVLVKALSSTGEVSTVVDDRNLIVLSGRNNICNFLIGNSGSYINDIAFGSGGAVTGNPNVALPVLPTDTVLNAVIQATKVPDNNGFADYSFQANWEQSPSPRVVFSIIVPQNNTVLNGELGQGQAINEIALMLSSTTPTAFAIKRFPTISKSDTISLLITWTIYI